MPNVFAANGFSQYSGNGSTPTYELITMAIASGNTNPIFNGDPVVQAASATGIGTGYITQAYGPVTLTVAATAITVTAAGVLTVTFSAATATSGTAPPATPNAWAPPVGSTLIINGATVAGASTNTNLNGAYTVTSSTTTTAVVANTNIGTGAVITSTASGTVTVIVPVAGIFNGCQYLSTATKRQEWSPYWPGSGSNGDVQAKVIADPNARFLVQTANSNTTATAVGLAQVGQNISFNWNDSVTTGETNGNTASGQSTFFADQFSLIGSSAAGPAVNAFLPFRIIGLANYIPGQASPLVSINGNDHASGYNDIIVGFNNAMPRNFAGI
jgi:hypothetical protein